MSEDQLENNRQLGELLIAAREKLALSQKEIASRLNLKVEIIAALDANDFDKLPAPTYVRGYIRSYARAVDLNADGLIDIYEDSAESPPEILPDVKPAVQASSRDKPVKAMTYLIAFTLVILIIAWWQGQHIVSTDIFSSGGKTSEGGKYPGGFTYSYDVVIHPQTLVVSETAIPENDEHKDVRGPSSPKIAEPSAADVETSDLLLIEYTSNLDTPKNADILEMELTAESWIEVYDTLGKKLYVNLAKSGEKIRLTGTAPLSVKLGNARAVSVKFNGKSFDTTQYVKAGVARFLLE